MLSALAPEILLDVFNFLDYADLLHLALANRSFHALASRVLYRRVVVTGKLASFAPIHALFLLLATRPYPARYVQLLHIDFFARQGCVVRLPPDMPPLVSAACAGMTGLSALCLGECFDALLRPAVQHAYFPSLARLSLHCYSGMEAFVARHAAQLTHLQCVWPLPLTTPHLARMTHFDGTLHNAAIACRAASRLVEFTSGNSGAPRQFIPCEIGFECLARNARALRRVRLYHYGSAASLALCFRQVTTPLPSVRDVELHFASPGLDAGELTRALPTFLAVFPRVRSLRLLTLASAACGECPVQFCTAIGGAARELETLVWAERAMRRDLRTGGKWAPLVGAPPPAQWTPIVPAA